MKLFNKVKSSISKDEVGLEKPVEQEKGLDIEDLIETLSTLAPKEMEKVLALAKARREYNQRLDAFAKSLEPISETSEEPEDPIESALNDLNNDDAFNFTEIKTELVSDDPEAALDKIIEKPTATKTAKKKGEK